MMCPTLSNACPTPRPTTVHPPSNGGPTLSPYTPRRWTRLWAHVHALDLVPMPASGGGGGSSAGRGVPFSLTEKFGENTGQIGTETRSLSPIQRRQVSTTKTQPRLERIHKGPDDEGTNRLSANHLSIQS